MTQEIICRNGYIGEKIKIAILGCGSWAQNVIRNLLKLPDIELTYCIDIDNNKLEKIKNKVPYYTQLFTDYHLPLNNSTINAIIICSPISTHPQLIQECLLKNKHVLAQKPAFRTMDEIEKVYPILSTEEGSKLILMACHTFCYHSAIEEIKSNLINIGNIQYYKSTRINLGLFNRDNNVCDDLLPHDASILTYLFSDNIIDYISATGTDNIKKGLIDTANVTIKYKSGLMANIDLSWISAVKNRQIILVGEKQTVVYDDMKSDNKICYYDAGINYDDKLLFSYQKGNMSSPRLDETEAIENELRHFFDCIKKAEEPKTGTQHIYKVTKMIEATNQSISKNGEPIYNV